MDIPDIHTRHTYQTIGHTIRHADTTDKHPQTGIQNHTDKQTCRQTSRQTNIHRQTDRQADGIRVYAVSMCNCPGSNAGIPSTPSFGPSGLSIYRTGKKLTTVYPLFAFRIMLYYFPNFRNCIFSHYLFDLTLFTLCIPSTPLVLITPACVDWRYDGNVQLRPGWYRERHAGDLRKVISSTTYIKFFSMRCYRGRTLSRLWMTARFSINSNCSS